MSKSKRTARAQVWCGLRVRWFIFSMKDIDVVEYKGSCRVDQELFKPKRG